MKYSLIIFLMLIITFFMLLYIRSKLYRKNKNPKQNELPINNIINNIEKYNIPIKKISYPIYYINMDKNIERKEYCEKQLSKISNNFTRIRGVVGKNIKNKKGCKIEDIEFINDYKHMSFGEIGCFLSHIKAINLSYDKGDKIAIICEDDVYTEPYKFFQNIEEIVKNAPVDWECLQLFSLNLKIDTNNKNIKYLDYDPEYYGCVSYLISRSGMKKILDTLNYPYHIKRIRDNFPRFGVIDEWLYSIVKTYTISPSIMATNVSLESTLHQNQVEEIHIPGIYNFLKYLNDIIPVKEYVLVKENYDVNFISHIFPKKYITNDIEKANIIIDNINSQQYQKIYDIPKITIDREPNDDSQINADLVITTKMYPKHKQQYIYVPAYSLSFAEYNISPYDLIKPKVLKEKNKFCAFVYSNCDRKFKGVSDREDFFELLQKMSGNRVDSWGKCKNNMKLDHPNSHHDNHKMFSKYKFVIAFENEYVDGYISEKITNPMLAGSIPIYLGCKNVDKHFNIDSFINVRQYDSWEKCIDYILHLDKDNEAYEKIFKNPWLKDNKLNSYFSWYKTD